MWGHIPAAEYRKVIIGLIFLRYISAAFDKRYKELVDEGDGFEDDRDAYEMDNVFFVPEEARWNNIVSKAHTVKILFLDVLVALNYEILVLTCENHI